MYILFQHIQTLHYRARILHNEYSTILKKKMNPYVSFKIRR